MKPLQTEGEVVRVRIPRPPEMVGRVSESLGASRFRVNCDDSRVRICSIPGSIKKRMWVETGDWVIVEPYSIQGDKKGYVIWRYTPMQADQIRSKGFGKNII